MKNRELFQGLSMITILESVNNHLENFNNTLDSSGQFQPTMICIVGSRLTGTHTDESDLDIAIAYKGSLREDDCLNGLMDEPLFIEDIKVDFIPYSEEKGNGIDLVNRHYILFMEDEESEEIVYDEEKMKRLVEKDGYLAFVYRDMRNRHHSSKEALRLLFNSNVLDDSLMAAEYSKA